MAQVRVLTRLDPDQNYWLWDSVNRSYQGSRFKIQDLIGLTKTQNEYNNKIMLVKIYNVHSRTGPSLRSGSRGHNPAQLDHHHHHQSLSVKNNFVYETFRTNKCKIYAPRSLEHAFRKSYMPLHLLRN